MIFYEFHHSCGIFFGHLDLKVMGYHVDPNSTGNFCTKIVMKSTSANVVLGQIERYHAAVRFVEFHCEHASALFVVL